LRDRFEFLLDLGRHALEKITPCLSPPWRPTIAIGKKAGALR